MISKNFRFKEGPFTKNVRDKNEIYHGGIILMKFSQTKLQVKNMTIRYYDLSFTVNKNRDEKNCEGRFEDNENHYINLMMLLLLIIILEGKILLIY